MKISSPLYPAFLSRSRASLGLKASGARLASKWLSPLAMGPLGHDAAPAPQLLDDGLAIDGQRQRLLDERIVERRPLAVDGEHVEPGVERALDLGRGIAIDALALIGGELGDDVHLALEHRGHARRRLGDRAHDPAVDLDLAAPVVGVGVEHGLVVLDPRHEANRARADGLGVESVVARRFHVLLRHDLAAVEREPPGQERIGLLGVDHERHGIRRLDPVDGGEARWPPWSWRPDRTCARGSTWRRPT